MQKLLLSVDRLSTRLGQAFSWLVVVLTLLISWEVFSRYALDHPHAWAFDAMIMMYGTVFMMAGAYTLSKNLTLYVLFFIPGVIAMAWAGFVYASESWAILEHSSITSDGPPVYPFKTVIPIAGTMLLLQGLVEMVRCVACIQQGEWPSREEDVEEVDVEKLRAMVQVKAEDTEQLGTILTGQRASK
jgi:TRAP-type mannitol/chloroaromatic compound transport system permease small subunit